MKEVYLCIPVLPSIWHIVGTELIIVLVIPIDIVLFQYMCCLEYNKKTKTHPLLIL
jgi:hypothetical protein